ncbi:MAG TPA: hypothetical protein VD908_14180 [Cytophagales bacterium]|nr:hypothetical protein [Cytophagales bacterium]
MATTALGPTLAGGLQPIVKNGYELIYYPDVNNDALQREGKPPVFYWLPNYVHLARKDGREDGDLMINVIRFAGVQSEDTNVGVTGKEEVAGGVLAFTVTSAPPDHVLKDSQNQIIQMFQGKPDFFWGIRSNQQPIFRPVLILSNITAVSNLSPAADGSVPVPTPTNQPGTSPSNNGNLPRTFRRMPVPPMITQKGFSHKSFGKTRDANLDMWYWNMQGQGNGSIDPMGQNAYSALVGSYPTAIIWAAFHGSYTPIFVQQALKIKFWVPVIEITIRGNWDKVFQHFSAAASGRYLWFSGDVKAEFNNMRVSGEIEVEVKIDTTIPGSDQISKYVDEKTNLVFEKFMEQAKKMIFDPPQPQVEAAQASSGSGLFGIWGAGFALKYRRDETKLDLYYHEKRQMSYLQDHTISSSLEGLNEEIQNNPESEKKYFQTIYMDDWPRKLGRIVKPIANWPKPELNWAGEPVAFLDAQIGYPNTNGELMWTGKTFQKSDPADISWNLGMTQKFQEDVESPPDGWKPDITFIKRTVHMLEPPDPVENPYVRVQIEDNEIELDKGENGTATNDVAIEVRADEAGRIRLGPINLNVELENNKQIVEVTFQATEESGKALERFVPVKFSFNYEDQETPRFWSVFTSDDSVRSFYSYKVRVIVKGSLFTKGMEWESQWISSLGNGPLMLSVPTPEDEGVIVKREYKKPVAYVPAVSPISQPASGGVPPSGPRAKSGKTAKEIVEGFTEFNKRTVTGSTSKSVEPKKRSPMPPQEKRTKVVPQTEWPESEEAVEHSSYKEV